MMKTLTCYQLIGVPGAGKSTWIKNQDWAVDIPVVSTDNFVEAYALEQGKTYNEVFKDYMPIAVKLMANQALICAANGLDVIWDQTSTTVLSRKRKFNTLPKYEHIAVVFKTPEPDELARRLASRPGKIIPYPVMRSMIDGFEMPTLEEGFKEIWYA
jgi:predicted kinase